MRSRFLTGLCRAKDHRRAATCLMTVLAIAPGSPHMSAHAEEREVPASLIQRGLLRAGLCDGTVSDGAIAAAQWLPELRLGARFRHRTMPWGFAAETLVFGELAWPLGRTPVGDAIRGVREGRQRSDARDSLVERIASAWHKRQQAAQVTDEIAARLDGDEADAELEALTGEDGEAQP